MTRQRSWSSPSVCLLLYIVIKLNYNEGHSVHSEGTQLCKTLHKKYTFFLYTKPSNQNSEKYQLECQQYIWNVPHFLRKLCLLSKFDFYIVATLHLQSCQHSRLCLSALFLHLFLQARVIISLSPDKRCEARLTSFCFTVIAGP